MLSTLKIKLLPEKLQFNSLLSTMKMFNSACNYISELSFNEQVFSKIKLQKMCYYDVRKMFGLSSQMTVRAIGKVTESYKTDKKKKHIFKETGAMVYDQRILSFDGLEFASILVLDGRIKVPMVFSKYHRGAVNNNRIRGQADLVLIDDIFYLMLCVERPDDPIFETDDFLGIDLGVINIATTSDGDIISGLHFNKRREKIKTLKSKLQSKNTKSSKRKLKKLSSKEQRFSNDVNHCVSKQIVSIAKDTRRGIALEDLGGIKEKTVKKAQRKILSSWAFYKLRQFISYKSQQVGVPVKFIDPAYTSQACSKCGNIDKNNRETQSNFKCTVCGYADNADINAAINIRSKAIGNLPIVANL